MNFNLMIKINMNFDFIYHENQFIIYNKRIFISIVINYYPNIEINALFN